MDKRNGIIDSRINVIIPTSLRFYGGGEITAILLSSELSRLGVINTLYVDSIHSGITRVENLDLIHPGINYKEVPMVIGNRIENFFFHKFPSVNLLKSANVNLIFIWRIPSKKQLRSCIESGSKIVLLLHGIGLEELRISNPTFLLYQLYMRLLLFTRKRTIANKKIYLQTLNSFQNNFLCKIGIPREKVFWIKNGIEVEKYKTGHNKDRFQILFIARMENMQKGIKRLIKVANLVKTEVPDVVITAIGSGKDSDLIKKSNNITYLGFVSNDRKLEELEKSSLLLCTSNSEVLPLAIVEGLCSGLPIVTTPVSGPKDIVGLSPLNGKISTFEPSDMVADVLSYYNKWKSNSDEYYENKIERSKRAREMFTVQKMASEYKSMIEIILNDS
ncbi:MAG: glycosyltransferase [Candidatus Thermoplasmatota archaeon]|nr:glycosyltransferase [Candidatus Thermoplasmatota archaeon]